MLMPEKKQKGCMPPSSRGLGHLLFTEATGIRIPLGVIKKLEAQIQTYLFNDKRSRYIQNKAVYPENKLHGKHYALYNCYSRLEKDNKKLCFKRKRGAGPPASPTISWRTVRLFPFKNVKNFIMMMIPLFTEKSARILENNQYTFDVDPSLSKPEIRQLVEETFQVKVLSINTHRPPRKSRRLGQYQGFRSQKKRVIFTLRPEDSIPLFE